MCTTSTQGRGISAASADHVAARQRLPIPAASRRVRVAGREYRHLRRPLACANGGADDRVRAGGDRGRGSCARCFATATGGAGRRPTGDGARIRSAVCAGGRYLAPGAEPGVGAVDRGDGGQPAAGARSGPGPRQTRAAAGHPGCAAVYWRAVAGGRIGLDDLRYGRRRRDGGRRRPDRRRDGPSPEFRAGRPGRVRPGFARLSPLRRRAGRGGCRRRHGAARAPAGGARTATRLAIVAERHPRGAADQGTPDPRRRRKGGRATRIRGGQCGAHHTRRG